MATLAICTLLAAHAQDSRNPSFLVGVTNVKNNYAAGKQKGRAMKTRLRLPS